MRHPVDRLSCRPKRPAPAQRCSRSPEIAAHDPLKSLLTIPRNICSRCSEIRAHDPAKRARSDLGAARELAAGLKSSQCAGAYAEKIAHLRRERTRSTLTPSVCMTCMRFSIVRPSKQKSRHEGREGSMPAQYVATDSVARCEISKVLHRQCGLLRRACASTSGYSIEGYTATA